MLKQSDEVRLLETNQLRSSLEQRDTNIRELQDKLMASEEEHQKAMREETEKHKTQLEAIRSRFKFMASTMERSPSDTSLEKIEVFVLFISVPCGSTKIAIMSNPLEITFTLIVNNARCQIVLL